MSTEITSHRATEKFSFIYTLTVSHDFNQDLESTETISVENEASGSEMAIEDWIRELKNSSALVKRSTTSNPSSLVVSEPTTISDRWYHLDLNPAVSELDLLSIPPAPNSDSPTSGQRYLDKIFFTVACGYFLFGLCWLLGSKNPQFPKVFAFITGQHQGTISQSDAEFLDYMERSLEVIDRKLLAQKKEITTASQNHSSNNNIVYVPVYTPNPNIQAENSTPIPLPPPPPPIAQFNPPVARIIPPPPPPIEPETPVNIPDPPESIEEAAIPEVAAVVKPTKSYTLVGLIQLGAKPTAMFKGKGGTKRVAIGQNIDDSGWKLQAIKERNVVIIRQGKSRNIEIGEKF